ncbi:DUF6443 domain-containing protein [Chryseobacterium cheonjiense]|uniref:DUF4160 domain-containing protein n=1 Tax=Chryseobacterium cheonjiense TaxID=2728845 RepID=A0A7Y0A4X3_9FLAO|nr:DUF6443 domain-containing protein [Chryseobacterium cheonjiense]NML56759.1 DUF4160 domain-containing protein [Chryseobacterium cheonjiense]
MKKYSTKKTLSFLCLMVAGISYAQVPTSNENFIQNIECLSADCVKQSVTVDYFDGLGRPKQIVNVKASPTQKDVVTHIEYDGFGRQVKDYLPVPQSNTLNGNLVTSPLTNATNPIIYGSEKIFAEKKLENSPLDRLQEQTKVGNDWTSKPIRYEYLANSANDIRVYSTTTNTVEGITNSGARVGGTGGYYKAGTIYKKKATDEDGNVIYEYTNGRGQLLLVRRVLSISENADTYYVYNEYNQQAFIIPPKASDTIKNLPAGTPIPDEVLNNLCYQYRYDGKNRLAEKKLPNKDWEYFVYDKQDRLVLKQDAVLKTTNNNFQSRGWIFNKYDESGRVVYTGFYPNSDSRQAIQTEVDNITSTSLNNESRITSPITLSGTNLYYRNLAFPSANITLLTVNYYDTYSQEAPAIPQTVLGQWVLPQTLDANNDASTNGLLTASYMKNVENNGWTKTFSYYDTAGNVIATKSANHLGGYTNNDLLLSFLGKTVEKSITYHKRLITDTEKVITETFGYDHQNRLLIHKHQVNSNPVEILAQNEYNELSQLKNKKVGGTNPASPLESIDYSYNIQGWLTKVNNPQSLGSKLFAYEVKFNNPTNTNLSAPYYIGNIAEIDWIASGGNGLKRYSYQYDPMGRLKRGIYSEPNASIPENNYYNELLTYDLNGNVLTLKRNREAENIGAQLMDDLTYSYTGNRLDTVIDGSGNYFGYPDTSGNVITYDENANMTNQIDKGFLEIKYNYLNLPNYVKFNQSVVRQDRFGHSGITVYKNTTYIYRADGSKLKKVHNYFSGRTQADASITTEYLDGFQYNAENTGTVFGDPLTVLQFVSTSEGYFDFMKNKYFYQYKDQIGNIRLTFFKNDNGIVTIDRTTDFYPFGLEFGGSLNTYGSMSTNYTYAFQEQEKQQDTGWSSFKWRNYDPTYVRFFNVDPLAEQYAYQSPFNFSENKVISHRELEGLEAESINNNDSSLPDDPMEFASMIAGGINSVRASVSNLVGRGINSVIGDKIRNKYVVDEIGGLVLQTGVPVETTKEKVVNTIGDLATIGLAVAGGPEGMLMAQGGKAPALKGLEEIKSLQQAGKSKTGKFTEPTLPNKTIVNENGITIEHYYKSGDHAPAHLHVKGGGNSTKIGANGKPIKGSSELSKSQQTIVEKNKSAIRGAGNKINNYQKYHNYLKNK